MASIITIRGAVAAATFFATLSVGAAQANDSAVFRDVLKPNGHERSKSVKLADGNACGTSGATHTIRTTMPAFEECMRAKGWVLDHYAPDPSVPVHGTLDHYTDTRGDAQGIRAAPPSFTPTGTRARRVGPSAPSSAWRSAAGSSSTRNMGRSRIDRPATLTRGPTPPGLIQTPV